MKLRSGRRIVRKKNIYLPTEVWVDILCFAWIARSKLAQMVDKIGNFKFAEHAQFYLHEWGKHTLKNLYFKQQGIRNYRNFRCYGLHEYPQTAMPENIKFCEYFQIDHFDNRVFNFFRRIQSLFTADTELYIRYVDERYSPEDEQVQVRNARTILGHLLPFIDGIHAIYTDGRMLPVVRDIPPEQFNQIKMFYVHLTRFVQSTFQPIVDWLTITSNNSNERKLLQLCCANDEINKQVLEAIRKQFMEAAKPSTFAVLFRCAKKLFDSKCENGIGEKLYGTCKKHGDFVDFYVFRHQANAEAGNQLCQWVDANPVRRLACFWKQCIGFVRPTIGPGDIFAMPDLDEDEADEEEPKEEDDEPITSNKGRICN